MREVNPEQVIREVREKWYNDILAGHTSATPSYWDNKNNAQERFTRYFLGTWENTND